MQSAKTRPGADCGSDHELLLPNSYLSVNLNLLQFKLKEGKTIRPFGYGQNQTANDYTLEVRNRFKGLDLID